MLIFVYSRRGSRASTMRGGQLQEVGRAPGDGPRDDGPEDVQELRPLERPESDESSAAREARTKVGGSAKRDLSTSR